MFQVLNKSGKVFGTYRTRKGAELFVGRDWNRMVKHVPIRKDVKGRVLATLRSAVSYLRDQEGEEIVVESLDGAIAKLGTGDEENATRLIQQALQYLDPELRSGRPGVLIRSALQLLGGIIGERS